MIRWSDEAEAVGLVSRRERAPGAGRKARSAPARWRAAASKASGTPRA